MNQSFRHEFVPFNKLSAFAPSYADELERRDRPYSAAGARRRLEIFQQLQEEESKKGVGKVHLPSKQYP